MIENKSPPRDYRQEVTNDIIRLLEEGAAPWQKPWEGSGGLPMNATTGKPYRGGNVISLMIAGIRNGYTDPRWMTFNQMDKAGWRFKGKQHHTGKIEYFETKLAKNQEEEDDPRYYALRRVFLLYNAEQVEGVPPLVTATRDPWQVCEDGENMLKQSGADIRHGGGRAFYNRASDHIQLPEKQCFISAPAYYGTAAHELIHWTGNEKRLNRETLNKSRGFDRADDFYSREELIAEIGSMMLAVERGIPHDPSQHAAYVASWIKALKNDKNEIFRAASAASDAVDWVLQRQKDKATEPPPDTPTRSAFRSAAALHR